MPSHPLTSPASTRKISIQLLKSRIAYRTDSVCAKGPWVFYARNQCKIICLIALFQAIFAVHPAIIVHHDFAAWRGFQISRPSSRMTTTHLRAIARKAHRWGQADRSVGGCWTVSEMATDLEDKPPHRRRGKIYHVLGKYFCRNTAIF